MDIRNVIVIIYPMLSKLEISVEYSMEKYLNKYLGNEIHNDIKAKDDYIMMLKWYSFM